MHQIQKISKLEESVAMPIPLVVVESLSDLVEIAEDESFLSMDPCPVLPNSSLLDQQAVKVYMQQNKMLEKESSALEQTIEALREERNGLETQKTNGICSMQKKIEFLREDKQILQQACKDLERKITEMQNNDYETIEI